MIRGTYEDGTRFWQFEKSEIEARRKFEQACLTPDLGELLEAVLAASRKAAQIKTEAFQSMREKIIEEFGDEVEEELAYKWLTGRIVEQKDVD